MIKKTWETPPGSYYNLFADMLKQPHFKNKSYRDKVYVVGLAKGRDEALELVRCIVDDTYSHTGGVDVAGYLRFGTELRKGS